MGSLLPASQVGRDVGSAVPGADCCVPSLHELPAVLPELFQSGEAAEVAQAQAGSGGRRAEVPEPPLVTVAVG